MDVAELVLDYVRALVWPALLVFVVLRYRRGIRAFFERIAGESQEFSASAFGMGINAKFQERLADLAKQSEDADPEQLRESVRQTAHDFAADQFRALAADIEEASSVAARRSLVAAIEDFAEDMELDEILEFAHSRGRGERLAAAVGLRVRLAASVEAREEPKVLAAIGRLLRDQSSLVRYRAVEILRRYPQLAGDFEQDLTRLATGEKNRDVRELAGKALVRARS